MGQSGVPSRECPGSRSYATEDGVEVIARGGESGLPIRARCLICGKDYQLVGPATYRHLPKHRKARA